MDILRKIKEICCTCVLLVCITYTEPANSQAQSNQETIQTAFFSPGFDAKPWVYWYWMYSTVTKEGIVADLKAFNDVGIGGVFLMDIGGVNDGTLVNRSEEWYDLVRLALTEAKKYGIRVSFASPGWSSSGGPWVTPEMSMKEITWSEVRVNNRTNGPLLLPVPFHNLDYYRDIAVIAFPSPAGDDWIMRDMRPAILDTAGNAVPDGGNLYDNDYTTITSLPGKFDIVFENEIEVSSVLLRARAFNYFSGSILVWDKNEEKFVKLSDIKANNAGPFTAQIGCSSFPSIKSYRFRFDINPCVAEELDISGGYRLADWIEKAGWGTRNLSQHANAPELVKRLVEEEDVIPAEKIICITDRLDADGNLKWKVPDGQWTILRIGYTSTGIKIYPAPFGGDGLECDKLSMEGTVFNYNNAIKPILDRMGPELSKTIASQHIDSYEASGQNWTRDFEYEFKKRCGYDIIKYLPALTGRIVESEHTTDQFLWDLRHTIGDLFAENHFGSAARESHKDGLTFSNEPYGGPFDFLKSGAAADYPMDEFWIPATQPGERKLVLPGVNTGHINDKKIIGCEAFTSESPAIRWNEHPYMLKAIGDYVYCSGINRFVFHVSAHQPLIGEHLAPGLTCFGNGLHFDRNNTWWEHGAKEYVKYITTCQSMLQQGEHLADVLYFQGSDSPSDIKWLDPVLPVGYDFDACSEDVLMKLKVIDDLLTLPSGKHYKYLVLPASGLMTTPILQKVMDLAKAGASVIGSPPGQSPGLSDEINSGTQVRADIISQIWGDYPDKHGERQFGAGRIIWGSDFKTILAKDNLVTDFSYSTEDDLLINYTHRYTENSEIYFVANGKNNSGRATCRFRIRDMVPEFYDPYKGTHEPCSEYKSNGDYIEIPVWFDESGSLFVVFNKSKTHGPYKVSETSASKELSVVPFNRPWKLIFPKGWGAPEEIELINLISFPEHQDEGIKYFSGTVEYYTTIDVQKKLTGNDRKIFIDLGQVEVIARVKINGKDLGTYWKPPFKIDATSAIKSGKNYVQISVTNLWPNRLIGDERQYPADESYDSKAWKYYREWKPDTKNPLPDPRRFTFTLFRAWNRDDELLPSGLIGPVTLRIEYIQKDK